MKRYFLLGLMGVCFMTQAFAQEGEKMTQISKVESRASIVVNQSEYKNYFTGDVRVDMLYPQSNAKTHGGAYVTFEPSARTHWHIHPAGQHIIVTSGVGYYQAWGASLCRLSKQVMLFGFLQGLNTGMVLLKRLL